MLKATHESIRLSHTFATCLSVLLVRAAFARVECDQGPAPDECPLQPLLTGVAAVSV
jgi:hypothetical protein